MVVQRDKGSRNRRRRDEELGSFLGDWTEAPRRDCEADAESVSALKASEFRHVWSAPINTVKC